ncbi:efflux transporter outer membrane subunit [Nitrospirillum sp. BR 11163]|uniref:efflux transporter outer membrane subunit n=1 Tax=Nitrospirillum sp. BR 11163 TaxID=3104323 RepID=UPI002AFF869D|nr:efflux transporter outer membrane subunit [Nitrospirillum sp. BR 11163]MEA1674231.1 efflux transporter outer membrane subunit [Nitrospirillum sp. BR 11163]
MSTSRTLASTSWFRRLATRRLAVAFMPLMLAACALDGETPADPAKSLVMPSHWDATSTQGGAKDGTTQTVAVTTDAAAWPTTDWWSGFNSPELTQLLAQARADNPDLGAAAARIAQAEAQAEISGASLWPSVQLGLSSTRSGSRNIKGSAAAGLNGAVPLSDYAGNVHQASLSASYEIDFWGKNRATRDSAQFSLDASRFDSETVALSLSSNVAATYFQILAIRDRLAVARGNLENAEHVLSLIDARVQAGADSQLDLVQQRSIVATQRAAVPALEQQERTQLNALAILLGRAPEGFTVQAKGLADVQPPALGTGVPAELLTRRPDIRFAEAQLAAAGADIKVARTQMLPSVTLNASTGVEAATLAHLVNAPTLLFSLGGDIAQSLFSGGRLEGQVHQAEGRHRELAEDYRKAALSALSDVESAVYSIDRYQDQYGLQKDAVAQSQRAFELAEDRYRGGLTDLQTLLDTQRTLLSTQDTLAQVKLSRVQASVSLFKALGGGWQDDGSSFLSQAKAAR